MSGQKFMYQGRGLTSRRMEMMRRAGVYLEQGLTSKVVCVKLGQDGVVGIRTHKPLTLHETEELLRVYRSWVAQGYKKPNGGSPLKTMEQPARVGDGDEAALELVGLVLASGRPNGVQMSMIRKLVQ